MPDWMAQVLDKRTIILRSFNKLYRLLVRFVVIPGLASLSQLFTAFSAEKAVLHY